MRRYVRAVAVFAVRVFALVALFGLLCLALSWLTLWFMTVPPTPRMERRFYELVDCAHARGYVFIRPAFRRMEYPVPLAGDEHPYVGFAYSFENFILVYEDKDPMFSPHAQDMFNDWTTAHEIAHVIQFQHYRLLFWKSAPQFLAEKNENAEEFADRMADELFRACPDSQRPRR